MDLENIMLNEISQTEKNKYCVIPLMPGTWTSHIRRNSRTVAAGGWGGGVEVNV